MMSNPTDPAATAAVAPTPPDQPSTSPPPSPTARFARALLALHLAALATVFAFRLLFLAFNLGPLRHAALPAVLRALWAGLLFDFAVAAWLALPATVLYALATLTPGLRRPARALLCAYLATATFLLALT